MDIFFFHSHPLKYHLFQDLDLYSYSYSKTCAEPFRKMHEIAEHVMIPARMWPILLIHTSLNSPILTLLPMMLSMLGTACSCLQAHTCKSKSPNG